MERQSQLPGSSVWLTHTKMNGNIQLISESLAESDPTSKYPFHGTGAYSRTATDDLTRNLTVLSRNVAVKITSDFHAKRRPQNKFNLLQIRRIYEQVIKGHNKNIKTIINKYLD